MATTNDITGDSLVSKAVSNAYRDNFERTFGVRQQSKQDAVASDGNDAHNKEVTTCENRGVTATK